MPFVVNRTEEVQATIDNLEQTDQKRYRKVIKCLALLAENPRHSGLNTHRYSSLDEAFGERIWESYVENNTPSAWRIWWFYGAEGGQITVVDLGPHR
jgi:hypothetical protein